VRYPHGDELPDVQERANRRAIRLEWISLVYWLSAIVAIYFALGQSQAMKAAWVEDILALFPPIAFLVASRFRHREPNERFPWGYHRAITVAYVVATAALFALGLFILIDSVEKLLGGTHPPIGMVEIFEWQVWSGWVMLAALAYSGVPPLILGRMKEPLAADLHDKVLHADARMNRADWLTAGAAAVGVIGIGLGLWWADAVAAIVISLDIVHDGQRYLRESVADLMDEHPKTHDEEKPSPVVDQIKQELASVPWIEMAAVRMREHGHLITGDIWVVPSGSDEDLPARLERLGERLHALDWRVHDVALAPVESLEDVPDGVLVRHGKAEFSRVRGG
jgi:cation diffusion facilitator family transporter